MFIGYHILVKFFKNGDPHNDFSPGNYHYHEKNAIEGDLQGIISELDYLSDLGIDLLYLGPIFKAETTHGYDTIDYFSLAEHVSASDRAKAEATFRELLAQAHQRGIKVILDLVINHASRRFDMDSVPARFNVKTESPQSPQERKWSRSFLFWQMNDPDTREFLIHVGEYWLKNFDIDGYRLDHALGVPFDFWAEFYTRVKAIKPDAILIGEVWEDMVEDVDDIALIKAFKQQDEQPLFTSLFNFPLQRAISETFISGKRSLLKLYDLIVSMDSMNDDRFHLTAFLDTHDMARFVDSCRQPETYRDAFALMMAISGNIMLEYGNEIALPGDTRPRFRSESGRVPMRFPESWSNSERQMFQFSQRLIRLRRERAELRQGTYHLLTAGEDHLIFSKRFDAAETLIAIVLKNLHDANLPLSGVFLDLIRNEHVVPDSLRRGVYYLTPVS